MVNIIPISQNGIAARTAGATSPQGNGSVQFKDVLKNAINEVEKLESTSREDSYNLSIGNIDDLGTVAVNSQKAEIALQLMVQMRNKMIDSYSEIMRMNI